MTTTYRVVMLWDKGSHRWLQQGRASPDPEYTARLVEPHPDQTLVRVVEFDLPYNPVPPAPIDDDTPF